jgi:hypothetical protein
MYHYMCDQTHPMLAMTQNESQHVLTKQIPSQRAHKVDINMC